MRFYPVTFKPIPTERVWGGHRMKAWFGAQSLKEPIGEYWLVSGHPSATSVVAQGPLAGMTLNDLTTKYPEAYLGASPQPRFPLLIKLIEASADLSVQVHPDNDYANIHEHDFGKTEAWYVLDAPPQGKVVYGHHFASREDFLKAVADGRIQEGLNYRYIRKGDVVYVPSRTLHALLAGTTVIEVQQTSDVTYRVYDWNRMDAKGNSRQLHVQQAADVLRYGDTGAAEAESAAAVQSLPSESGVIRRQLVQCPYFNMEKVSLSSGVSHRLAPHGGPTLVIGLSGEGDLGWQDSDVGTVRQGAAWLLPTTESKDGYLTANSDLAVLRVTY